MFTIMFIWMAYETRGDCWGFASFIVACLELGIIGKYVL